MTNEQKQHINLYIAETLFGSCYHEGKTHFGQLWDWSEAHIEDRCHKCKEKRRVVGENADYLSNYTAIAQARTKIAERGLQTKFIRYLFKLIDYDNFNPTFSKASKGAVLFTTRYDSWQITNEELFIVVNATCKEQALAIYETLTEVENEQS